MRWRWLDISFVILGLDPRIHAVTLAERCNGAEFTTAVTL